MVNRFPNHTRLSRFDYQHEHLFTEHEHDEKPDHWPPAFRDATPALWGRMSHLPRWRSPACRNWRQRRYCSHDPLTGKPASLTSPFGKRFFNVKSIRDGRIGSHHPAPLLQRCHFKDQRFRWSGRCPGFFCLRLLGFHHNLPPRRCKRANELIHRNVGRRSFNLRYPRLACFKQGSKLFLRQMESFALLSNRQSQLDTSVQQLTLLVAHFQKISRISCLPARGFNRFPFRSIHQSVLTFQFAFAPP